MVIRAQNTITFTLPSNRTPAMNRKFIVRDLYANVISYFKDGQYYTDTFKKQPTHYQTGELKDGLKQESKFSRKNVSTDSNPKHHGTLALLHLFWMKVDFDSNASAKTYRSKGKHHQWCELQY